MIKASKYIPLVILSFVLLFGVSSCETDEEQVDLCNSDGAPGELISANYFASFTPEQVTTYLRLYGAPLGLVPDYSVDVYQVAYKTLDKDNELTDASGVLFIPQGIDTLDLLSIQHGTVFKRDEVGSVNPLFYAFDGMIAAMSGYVVIEPDYLGLGSSPGLHPYLHAELSANAVIDGIRAARIYSCQNEVLLSGDLYLAGYSEGGFVTLATHKIIESEYPVEFQLMAVAPMAGPHDLLQTTRSIIDRKEYAIPAYLAYLVQAYDSIYEWGRLDEIFMEPYATRIPEVVNGSFGGSEINDTLTSIIDSLFVSEFKTSFLSGEETQITNALVENSPLDWGPVAPVRLFHGTNDSTVYYENSVTAYESMRANGGLSVELVPLSGADHGSAAFPAYYLALQWFDSLRTAN
jgi:hypothetical protein